MSEGYSSVKTVVQVLHDSQMGFADLGEKLKRPDLRQFFLAESATRGQFATELETELALAKGDTKDIGGTATGAIHRTWADLKAPKDGAHRGRAVSTKRSDRRRSSTERILVA